MKIPKRFEMAKWEDVPKNAKDLVENIADSRRGIYLTGPAGTGKTHIAYAIGKYCEQEKAVKYEVIVWNVPDLLREMREDYGRENTDKKWTFEKLLDFTGLLILDDIGAEKMTDWVEETFYLLINKRYEEMRPTIYTSNYSIEELGTRLNDRIVSRIAGDCDIVSLQGNDRRV